jgi:alpha-glucosidase (family GH31 glycosyl hydrolase)
MTRHAFIGTNRFVAKWTGEYDSQWDDFRASVISNLEMSMFGFSLVI